VGKIARLKKVRARPLPALRDMMRNAGTTTQARRAMRNDGIDRGLMSRLHVTAILYSA